MRSRLARSLLALYIGLAGGCVTPYNQPPSKSEQLSSQTYIDDNLLELPQEFREFVLKYENNPLFSSSFYPARCHYVFPYQALSDKESNGYYITRVSDGGPIPRYRCPCIGVFPTLELAIEYLSEYGHLHKKSERETFTVRQIRTDFSLQIHK